MTHHPAELPPLFLARLKEIVPPADYEAVIDSFSCDKLVVFRANTLKTTVEQVIEHTGATRLAPFDNILICPAASRHQLTHSPLINSGDIYIQSASSMLAPLWLDPQPGEEILDLTAAPGSKTTQMAALMQNQGRIAAVEKAPARFHRLKHNCQRMGVTCVAFYCKDGTTVGRACPNRFDRVLLDAPCSAEGRFHTHHPERMQYWSLKKVKTMARQQRRLLASAAESLKPGGRLVYSTCSFSPEENRQQIDALLAHHPGRFTIEREQCILPDQIWDGFYLCQLQKHSDDRI